LNRNDREVVTHFLPVPPGYLPYAEGVPVYAEGVLIIQPSEPSGRGAGGKKGKGQEVAVRGYPGRSTPRNPYAESVESSVVQDTP
jgi:hypothetical protein